MQCCRVVGCTCPTIYSFPELCFSESASIRKPDTSRAHPAAVINNLNLSRRSIIVYRWVWRYCIQCILFVSLARAHKRHANECRWSVFRAFFHLIVNLERFLRKPTIRKKRAKNEWNFERDCGCAAHVLLSQLENVLSNEFRGFGRYTLFKWITIWQREKRG